jgi:hypothetical protein
VQIHFTSQGNDLLRTGNDAEAASLAPLGIHHDGSFKFCHFYLIFNALNPEFSVQRYEYIWKNQKKKGIFFWFSNKPPSTSSKV